MIDINVLNLVKPDKKEKKKDKKDKQAGIHEDFRYTNKLQSVVIIFLSQRNFLGHPVFSMYCDLSLCSVIVLRIISGW